MEALGLKFKRRRRTHFRCSARESFFLCGRTLYSSVSFCNFGPACDNPASRCFTILFETKINVAFLPFMGPKHSFYVSFYVLLVMVSFYVSFLSLLLLRHGRDFCTADASAEQATMNRLGRCSSSMFSRRRSAIVRVVFKICKSPRVEIPNLVASLNRFLSFFERAIFFNFLACFAVCLAEPGSKAFRAFCISSELSVCIHDQIAGLNVSSALKYAAVQTAPMVFLCLRICPAEQIHAFRCLVNPHGTDLL